MSALFEEFAAGLLSYRHRRGAIYFPCEQAVAPPRLHQDEPIPVFDLFDETTAPVHNLINSVEEFASDTDALVNATFN